MNINNTLKLWAGPVLRYVMSAVILWFGIQQFLHTEAWTAYIPDSIVAITGVSATVLVYVNAVFEVLFGFLLLIGWQTRIVALLLGLHLLDIMWVVGYGEIGVRDFGLAMALLVVCMNGADFLSLDYKNN
ncbi:MAG: DoxX family membrane protein [bacterium]